MAKTKSQEGREVTVFTAGIKITAGIKETKEAFIQGCNSIIVKQYTLMCHKVFPT